MVLTYLAQMKGKMVALILENFSLFDSMHEGLIVLSSADNSLKFASQPAANLFSGTLQPT